MAGPAGALLSQGQAGQAAPLASVLLFLEKRLFADPGEASHRQLRSQTDHRHYGWTPGASGDSVGLDRKIFPLRGCCMIESAWSYLI
jgi:hypothetical protein